MKSLKYLLVIFLLIFSVSTSQAQWATSVSANGKCLLDENSNNIPGTCISDPNCYYEETGTTRSICRGSFFGWCYGGYRTEKLYVTECPIDDYIPLALLGVGGVGFFFLRKSNLGIL